MNIYEAAHGPCCVCGKLCEEKASYWDGNDKMMKPGSLYWTPLPAAIWNTVRPLLAPLFQDEYHIQNTLFIPKHSKPFCGPVCVQEYYKQQAVEIMKRGG